jgi:hypothetical protein
MDKAEVESRLKGNTLRVYIYALKKGKVGVREVQRSLGMSNSSLAQYHLVKLKEMGLLKDNNGEYEIQNAVDVKVMRDFLRLGTLMVPRFLMYAIFFTVLTLYFGFISIQNYADTPIVSLLMMLLGAASIIFWYETQKAWRSAP